MGARGSFVPYGPGHLWVVAGTVIAAAALVVTRARLTGRDDRTLRWGVAVLLAANELASWLIGFAHGHVRAPLQLCDLALALTVWSLIRAKPRVSEIAYFWGLAGSLQAVLTPDLRVAFPDYWWLKFFIGHCGVVLSVVYLAVTDRVRPTHRTVWKVWGWTNLYALIVGCLNGLFGTNYGYLAQKPMQPSVLDALGSWPYYVIGMEGLALLSFYLYYLPFVFARRSAGSTA